MTDAGQGGPGDAGSSGRGNPAPLGHKDWIGVAGSLLAILLSVVGLNKQPLFRGWAVALMLLAGLQTIPKSLYEAAEVDGATTWQQFVEITLPMLRPAIFVALIFRTITAIQTFDIPYAMTGGGPGDSTETLAMYIHKTTLDFLDFGYGSALAALMFVFSMAATSGYLKYTRRSASRSGD